MLAVAGQRARETQQIGHRREQPGVAGDAAEGVVGVAVGDPPVHGPPAPAGEVAAAVGHRVRRPGVEHADLDAVVPGPRRHGFPCRYGVPGRVQAERPEHELGHRLVEGECGGGGDDAPEQDETEVGVVAPLARPVAQGQLLGDTVGLLRVAGRDVERMPLPQPSPVQQEIAYRHALLPAAAEAGEVAAHLGVEAHDPVGHQAHERRRGADDLGDRGEIVVGADRQGIRTHALAVLPADGAVAGARVRVEPRGPRGQGDAGRRPHAVRGGRSVRSSRLVRKGRSVREIPAVGESRDEAFRGRGEGVHR